MELDFDKICTIDLSPNTVLPSRKHSSKTGKRNAKGKPTRKDELLVKDEFREIRFNRYRSVSCKSVPSREVGLENNINLRRGSVYQSSKEVRRTKLSNVGERRKIEISRCNEPKVSSKVVESLCSSDEESPHKRYSVMSLASSSNFTSASKHCSELCSSDGYIEIAFNAVNRKQQSAETPERDSVKDLRLECHKVVAPETDGNVLLERDIALSLKKSLSAKLEVPHSPPGEIYNPSKANSKVRFSPIRKMLDPFKKSKSLRSPLGYAIESGPVKITTAPNVRKNTAVQKSLVHDFANKERNGSLEPQLSKNAHHESIACFSPVHLHGSLKLQSREGVPYFEFSLKSPEDRIVAKRWKVDDNCNWVYTFHTGDSRKRSNANGWSSTDSKQELMVGQMQVSCHLSSKIICGSIEDSMVTEFVLHDIVHARNSTVQEPFPCSPSAQNPIVTDTPGMVERPSETTNASQSTKLRYHPPQSCDSESLESSIPIPWPSTELHPDLEIAAIVIDVPLEKRESLKFRRGEDTYNDKEYPNLLNLAMIDRSKNDINENEVSSNVKVIVPNGNHGVPITECPGPSSLLNRWRYGGGCDCGGWDMGCPLTILNNPFIPSTEVQPLLGIQQPFNLLAQGAKENVPALTLTVLKEGEYAVAFHAQLSTLQAFATCVAILHASETSTIGEQDGNRTLFSSKSLKMLVDKRIKVFAEPITGDEKKITEKVKDAPQSFAINPPFSPIARV